MNSSFITLGPDYIHGKIQCITKKVILELIQQMTKSWKNELNIHIQAYIQYEYLSSNWSDLHILPSYLVSNGKCSGGIACMCMLV